MARDEEADDEWAAVSWRRCWRVGEENHCRSDVEGGTDPSRARTGDWRSSGHRCWSRSSGATVYRHVPAGAKRHPGGTCGPLTIFGLPDEHGSLSSSARHQLVIDPAVFVVQPALPPFTARAPDHETFLVALRPGSAGRVDTVSRKLVRGEGKRCSPVCSGPGDPTAERGCRLCRDV